MRQLFVAALCSLAAAPAFAAAPAAEPGVTGVRAAQAWARATAPGAANGGVFMKLENTGAKSDKLLKASADVAQSVELHTHKMDAGIAKMIEVPAIDVPAGKGAELKPGGLHVMLIGLRKPLREGEKFPLTLQFEKAGTQKIEVSVQGIGAGSPGGHRAGGEHGK